MFIKKRKVILFGCGSIGEKAYHTYKHFYKLDFFSDNNCEKLKEPFNSLTAIHPNEINKYDFDFIIISSMFSPSIQKQLLNLGIAEKKIKTYSPALLDLHSFLYNFPCNILTYFYGLLFNPVAVLGIIINSFKVLLKSSAINTYNHFTAHDGLNSLFYWSALENLRRFGFQGKSPSMGSGDFSLSKIWHFQILSLYIYKKFAPLLPFISFLFCMLSFLLWMPKVSSEYCIAIISIGVMSYAFYANSFLSQNYNSLGWAFLPICLLALEINNIWFFLITSCLVAMASITANFCLGMMLIAISCQTLSFTTFLVYLPAVLISLINFLRSGNLIANFLQTIALINGGKNKKYKIVKSLQRNLDFFSFILIQLIFISTYIFVSGEIPILSTTSILIFIANGTLLRFADNQSLVALTLITSTYQALISESLLLLPVYFLVVNAPYCLLGFNATDNKGRLRILKPFDIFPLLDAADKFLRPTKKNSCILFTFENPNGNYDSIFDNQRVHLEVLHHIASTKDCKVIPNWWLISEDMDNKLPSFWGRDIISIKRNTSKWAADYIITYSLQPDDFEKQLQENGFKLLNTFDWKDFSQNLNECGSLNCFPKWFLFCVPANLLAS